MKNLLSVLIISLGLAACGDDDGISGSYYVTRTVTQATCAPNTVGDMYTGDPISETDDRESWIVTNMGNDVNYFIFPQRDPPWTVASYDGAKTFSEDYSFQFFNLVITHQYDVKTKFKDNKMTGTFTENYTVDDGFDTINCITTWKVEGDRRVTKK